MGSTGGTPRSVVVTQVAMGDYRQAFLDELDEVAGGGPIRFLSGEQYFEPSVRTRVRSSRVEVVDRNSFALGRRVVWQRGVVAPSVRADVAVVELNPRILSTWAIVAARNAMRRPTLAWGHAWGRAGREAGTAPVRRAMRALTDGLVLYTRT